MRDANGETFSYPASHPWTVLFGLALGVAFMAFMLAAFVAGPSSRVQVGYWLLAAASTVYTVSWARLVVFAFTNPHTISVSQGGIAGKPIPGPIHGPAVEMSWDQIQSVEVTRPFSLITWPRRVEVTRIRAYDGKTLAFNGVLPGYHELKRIVADKLPTIEVRYGGVRDANGVTFSYSADHAWEMLLALAIAVGFMVFWLAVFVASPSSRVRDVAYWVIAAALTAFTVWLARKVVFAFTEPHTISVSQRGIAEKPVHGPVVEISWDQIQSVEETQASTWIGQVGVTRIRAYDGRTLTFNDELPGYHELNRIIEDRLNRAGS